jgi:Rrf2 family protein
MLKLSKKADYALIALKHLATLPGQETASSADIAELHCVSASLMAKVLQTLARKGLLEARHGSSGGYALARDPQLITALEAITAIDGPVVITSCVTSRGECNHSPRCTVREPLRRVNEGILQLLGTVTISHMTQDTEPSGLVELRA